MYEIQRKSKISKNLTETQDRTIEKENIPSNRPKKRSNLIMRAAELLKDPLLDFDRKKPFEEEDEDEESSEIIFSALENPKSFMKANFPIVYPYTRKIKHVKEGNKPYEAKVKPNFFVYPENIELIYNNNSSCKKVWSPPKDTNIEKIDCMKIFKKFYL